MSNPLSDDPRWAHVAPIPITFGAGYGQNGYARDMSVVRTEPWPEEDAPIAEPFRSEWCLLHGDACKPDDARPGQRMGCEEEWAMFPPACECPRHPHDPKCAYGERVKPLSWKELGWKRDAVKPPKAGEAHAAPATGKHKRGEPLPGQTRFGG